jgi:ABC-type uncharacterized transport system involved in gliding motility auxiliary subunit
MERRKKAATESGALLLVVGLILVAVNALSFFMYYRKDATKAEKYTLSEGSGRLLRNMKGEMKAEAYVTKGLPKLDAYVRDLRDLLQQYKEASKVEGKYKFDYQIIEAKDEEQKKKAKEAGLQEMQFGEGAASGEDKAEFAKGYMGLVLNYGAEKETVKALSPDNNMGLEFWITNKIREVRDRGDQIKHKVGVLTGHDEIKLSEANLLQKQGQGGGPSMQSILTQYFPFYTFVDVDLKAGDAEIDDSLDGLVITQPAKDLTDKELRRIDAFVMKGKSLAVVAGAVNTKAGDASSNATLSTHGLEKLLDGYGIELRKDVVLDFGRPFRVGMWTPGGPQTARFPPILDVHDDYRFTGNEALLDASFPAFFRIPQVPFPFSSSIVLHRDKQPDISPDKFKVLARSTPRSQRREGDTVDLKLAQRWAPQKGEFTQYDIAAGVEGKLKSAFAGADKMGVEAPNVATNTARVLVIASSQFFTNPFARAGNGPDMGGQMGMMMPPQGDELLLQFAQFYAQQILTNTILVAKNLMDWVTGDVDLLAASAKIIQEPGLAYGDVTKPSFEDLTDDQLKKQEESMKKERSQTQVRVAWTLIAGLPLLFALVGLIVWQTRNSRRENASRLLAAA